jgi:tripartite ATP-independent transporter DctM subunit
MIMFEFLLDPSPLAVTVIMFSTMLFMMVIGAPLAWALMVSGMLSAYLMFGTGGLDLLLAAAYSTMDNFILISLPLFLLMGLILERSGITDDLFDMIYKLMGFIPGGLGVGTVFICAVIAAMAGVSGAATVSLGLIALPAMIKRGYEKKMVMGTIMAGGALGFLIPPSLLMIIYAFLSRDSVGKLFVAGIVPGLLLAAIYIVYILIRSWMDPKMGPPVPHDERVSMSDKLKALRHMLLPGILVLTVLSCIIFGVTSPSEASAIGAGGALLVAALRGRLNMKMLKDVLLSTTQLTGMLIWIAIAAVFFSRVYIGLGAGMLVSDFVLDSNISPKMIIFLMLVSFFVLGMFLDDFAIAFITVPIFVPIVNELGFDTIWFAILFVLSMQTAYLTPPFGYNLFYMRSVVPKSITIYDIYLAAMPFIFLQTLGLMIVFFFPEIVMWLPNKLFNQ